jgi:hypothetical protein
MRREAKTQPRAEWPIHWAMDPQPSKLRFRGYAARRTPSVIGDYLRLSYDRSQPWDKEIDFYNRFHADVTVPAARAYVLPQAWRAVAERLQWNGVRMARLEADRTMEAEVTRIVRVASRPGAYEGHLFHDEVEIERASASCTLKAGDWWIPLDQPAARYVVETLEPVAHDSFFRWGFFNSVLEKKEHYSDYVFEDTAAALLESEPALKAKFEAWKTANPALLKDQAAVLDFLYMHCARHAEPEWRRYPVLAIR